MTVLEIANRETFKDIGWGPMLIFSALFHVAVVALFFFVPDSFPTRRPIQGIVYEVNLVDLPARGISKPPETTPAKSPIAPEVKGEKMAKRIDPRTQKKKPLVIAKRTVEKKETTQKRPERSPTQLIERAISRIEKKVRSESRSQSHVDRAITEIKEKVGNEEGVERGQGGAAVGIPMRLYQMEVENLIKSNWAYPVAMEGSKDLEATVVVRVKSSGTVLETRFIEASGSDIFDQSVLKAIERSNPLPPFPEIYRKNNEDFEINFNLKELDTP